MCGMPSMASHMGGGSGAGGAVLASAVATSELLRASFIGPSAVVRILAVLRPAPRLAAVPEKGESRTLLLVAIRKNSSGTSPFRRITFAENKELFIDCFREQLMYHTYVYNLV